MFSTSGWWASQADLIVELEKGHLRKMGDFLSHIGNVQLKEDPARVACAVDEILKLFDRLEITVKQTTASKKRIEAARSS